MTLEEVIKMLEKEFERAKTLSFVRDPLAYALYSVWKKVDETHGRRKKNSDDNKRNS